MDQITLAKEISSQLLGSNSAWFFLILVAAFAAAGAYFGRYLTIKAENLATKEDFGQLQKQLAQSTHLVESVKSEVAHLDWVAREWEALRVKKIEELMTAIYECEIFLDDARNAAIEGSGLHKTDPFGGPQVIAELYLPELTASVNTYTALCRVIYAETLNRLGETLKAISNMEARQKIWNTYPGEEAYKNMLAVKSALTTQARDLLRQTVGD